MFNAGKIINQFGEFVLEKNGNVFSYNDINIEITEAGSVLITSQNTPVEFVYLEIQGINTEEVLVCGDAWERGYSEFTWDKPNSNRVMPWYFAICSNSNTMCYGVKTAPNSFCSWKCANGRISLLIDIRNGSEGIILNSRILEACVIVTEKYDNDEFAAMRKFCKKMCDNPRIANRPVFGGNDWYCRYGDNNSDTILNMTKRIVECSPKGSEYKPYMVIDDGWEVCHCRRTADCKEYNGGPWKTSNNYFGDIISLAKKIEELGAIPGIWLRPLLTMEKVPEECILRKKENIITLDPSSEKTLNIISEDFQRLKKWGYKLIKHDFSSFDIFDKWGFEMGGKIECNIHFHDKTRTTAEVIKNFYMTIREVVGDDVLIMGCNTFSHLSAGIFDIQRTGDDTSGVDWERTKEYGINTLAFRIIQQGSFYQADADCVGITKEIDWSLNRQWLDVLSKSNTPLFVSIAEDAYSDEVENDIKSAFENVIKASNISCPKDWKTTSIPRVWKSDFGTDSYEW